MALAWAVILMMMSLTCWAVRGWGAWPTVALEKRTNAIAAAWEREASWTMMGLCLLNDGDVWS